MAAKKPHLSFTLWRYLARRFFITVLVTQGVLSLFVMLLDAVELLRKFSDMPEVPASTALILTLLKQPDMALQLAPFAVLIGTLISFARLTQGYELIALRNAGLPARTFIMPALLVVLVMGVFNLVALNPLSATLLKQYEYRYNAIFPGAAKGLVTKGGNIWLKQPEYDKELFFFAHKISNSGRVMEKATVFTFTPNGTFVKRQDAEKLILTKGQWVLLNVSEMTTDQTITFSPQEAIKTSLTPHMIQQSFNSPRTLSVFELKPFIDTLSATGFNTSEHAMRYHRLLASPALMLAMFFLAIPFALRFNRNYGLGAIVINGLAFGFVFYIFGNMMAAYALTGRLPLVAAAWLPTVVALCIGLYFFLHFREE